MSAGADRRIRIQIRIRIRQAAGLVLACCAALGTVATRAATFVDDAGRGVVLERPASRVIALAPSLTELVDAVGGGPALVGAVAQRGDPDAARTLPSVGDDRRFDIERILALQPDLVLAWQHGNPSRELAQLESAGLRLFYLEPTRLDDVPRALERVGALLGLEDAGRDRAARLRADLAALRAAHAEAPPVRVFYQVWRNPLLTLNGRQIVSDVMRLCGGRNVFADLPQLVPQLSTESVVGADPEVVLAAREDRADADGARRAPNDPAFAGWLRHRGMTAVRRGWLYTLPGSQITRQGPRIVEGARAVCEALDEVRRERAARP